MIHYLCPALDTKSAGMRILYRHIQILCASGIDACILFPITGFRPTDVPDVPMRELPTAGAVQTGDMVVVPEVMANYLEPLSKLPIKLMVIAQSWCYIYEKLPEGKDYRHYNVSRVLTNSAMVADHVRWTMRLPVDMFSWRLDESLFFHEPEKKVPQIMFIRRKQEDAMNLVRAMFSRNPDFATRIKWVGVQGMPQAEYAEMVRRSQVFLNLSRADAMPCAILEAMRSGTLVAGWNSVGGQRELIGEGEKQNCILAENLDYLTLARRMEPLLNSVLADDLSPWQRIRENAFATAAGFTREEETDSVIGMWKRILENFPPKHGI